MDHVADKPVQIQVTVLESELGLSTRPGRLPLNSLRIVCSIIVSYRVTLCQRSYFVVIVSLGNLRLCKPEAGCRTQIILYEVL
jgi:hypothetical protein